MRVSGKNWKEPVAAFRPTAAIATAGKPSKAFELRRAASTSLAATKAKEKEMKDEKEAVRQERIVKIKERRQKKEEKERWAKMEEKMHRKKVERRKRKEARNKLLKS